MKSLILLLLFLAVGRSCSQSTETVSQITLNYSSAMCQGYCDTTIVVSQYLKKTIKKPGTVIPSPELKILRDSIPLTAQDWVRISNSFKIDSIKALPKVNGCPGCDDGAIGMLQVVTSNDTISFQFEGPDPPVAIQKLINMIKEQ